MRFPCRKLLRPLEDHQLIGRVCKHRNVFSWPVLMAEDLTTSYGIWFLLSVIRITFGKILFIQTLLVFVLFPFFSTQSWGYSSFELFLNHSGGYYREATPVPIPNTVVKLSCVDNTWLVTAREDRSLPDFYSSIAQLVEHAAVNRRVVGSSPTWGAKLD